VWEKRGTQAERTNKTIPDTYVPTVERGSERQMLRGTWLKGQSS